MSALTDLVARLPWVTRLEKTRACDGFRWGHMPLAALDSSQTMEKFRCRARARWQFTGIHHEGRSRRVVFMDAPDGTYCWQHLCVMLRHNPDEDDRTIRELRRLRKDDENKRQETTDMTASHPEQENQGQIPVVFPGAIDRDGELIIRAKGTIDEAATLEEAAVFAETFAAYLRQLAADGWELAGPVTGDYGFARKT
jgi:hypothetical protein